MIDDFGRKIDYLRVSVTDRCNLRCLYCMPEDGIELLRYQAILSFEEIIQIAEVAVRMGITKIRLTGGEPLVRKDILTLVEKLAGIDGLEDLAMTSNGVLLSAYAQALADSGLNRINISLDTIDPDRYRHLTRCGDIRKVFEGIEAAQKAGLSPVKLNCVYGQFSEPSDIYMVKQFGRSNNLQVRIIRQMCFKTGFYSVVESGKGGDCPRCNRLRLSSDGKIYPCLFSNISFDIRQMDPEKALKAAVLQKPESGGPCSKNLMNRIGG